MATPSAYVGRLAPSPTGAQHVGNARTYLIAWLSARSQGSRLPLRVEDIDAPRVKPGYVDLILEDLRWLGLDWDGEPVIQSRRTARHEAALRRLQEMELVYPCTCSRADIARAASAPHAENEVPVYPGTCSGRRVADEQRSQRADIGRNEHRPSRSPGRWAVDRVVRRRAQARTARAGSPRRPRAGSAGRRPAKLLKAC